MKITHAVIKAITAHAQREMPHEACGYLVGDENLINHHYEMTNMDKAADHFSMDPQEQFATVKDMREHGYTLVAVYHSHPETPSRPSKEDIRLAYDPNISHVIISLAEPKNITIKSFKICKGNVSPEEIDIVEREEECMAFDKKIDTIKNCRGVGCPMNLVYAKVALAKLKSGQVMEIILDDGPPINNVPGSLERESHFILEKSQQEDGARSVLVEKA